MTEQTEAGRSPAPGTNRRKIIVIAAAVLIIVAAIVVYNVLQGRPKDYVTVSGQIESTEVTLSSKLTTKVLQVLYDEGSMVRKGDVLVRLRDKDYLDQVAQAQSALANAQARLSEGVHGATIQDIEQARAQVAQAQAAVVGARKSSALAGQSLATSRDLQARLTAAATSYRAATAALDQAQQALRLVRQGPRTEEIRQAGAAVVQAEAQSAKAAEDLRRAQVLYRQGAIAANQLDSASAAAATARAQLDQARARLSELQAGSRPEEIRQAEAAVRQAEANASGARASLDIARREYNERLQGRQEVTTAQTQYETSVAQLNAAQARLQQLLVGTRPEVIAQLRAQVEQAQYALAAAKDLLTYAVVRSPITGTVVQKAVEPGELVSVGSPLMVVDDLRSVWLRVYVEEPVYGRIRLGQQAVVTTDSYPNQSFIGKVTEISSRAEFTPKEIQTQEQRAKLVFGVKVTLQNPDGKLKPGMPAEAVLKLIALPASGVSR